MQGEYMIYHIAGAGSVNSCCNVTLSISQRLQTSVAALGMLQITDQDTTRQSKSVLCRGKQTVRGTVKVSSC